MLDNELQLLHLVVFVKFQLLILHLQYMFHCTSYVGCTVATLHVRLHQKGSLNIDCN